MQYIALAEDHPHLRGLISNTITQLSGYGLSIAAESGYQLIKQIKNLTVLPTIAIIDIQMPEMDGVATTHFLSTHYPTIKVLAISLHTHPTIIKQMLHAGAGGFLAKNNLTNTMIVKAFDSILSGTIFIDDTITDHEILLSPINQTITNKITHPHLTEKEKQFLIRCTHHHLNNTNANYCSN